jgi:PAS domain S-box-containing protein
MDQAAGVQAILQEMTLLCRQGKAPVATVAGSLARLSSALKLPVGLRLADGHQFGADAGGLCLALDADDGGSGLGVGDGLAGHCLILAHNPPDSLREPLLAYGRGLVGFLRRVSPTDEMPAGGEAAATDDRLRALQQRVDRRNALLQSLFDLSPVGVILFDLESGIISEVNKAFLSFGNWSRDAILGQHIFALVPEHSDTLRRVAAEALQATGRFGPFEETLSRPNGEPFPVVIQGIRFPTGDDRQIVWIMVEDVSAARAHTAQLSAARDAALRAREELDTAIAALPHGFLLFDPEDRILLTNPQMATLFPGIGDMLTPGTPYADFLHAVFDRGLIPEAEGQEEAFCAAILNARAQGAHEQLFRLRDGRMIHGIDHPTPTGSRVGLLIDVTEVHDAAQRLAHVIEGSQAGTWEVDLTTGRNIVNERWAEMLGYSIAELGEVTTELWSGLIHPEDRAHVLDVLRRLLEGGSDRYEEIYRMRHRDGRWIWIDDRCRVTLRDRKGQPLCLAGVHFDISPLKETQLRLEQIIEGARVGTWQFHAGTGTNVINDRWATMLGYRREEVTPQTDHAWRSLIHPDDYDRLRATHMVLGPGTNERFEHEIRLRHKAGHWVWVLSRGKVMEWTESGEPLLMAGVHIDISARKDLETALEGERNFLSQLMETSVSGIMAVDEDSRIVFANSEMATLLEQPVEALVGIICNPPDLSLTGAEGQAITLADMPCRIVLATGGTVRNFRLRYNLPDGRVKVFSVNAAPIANPSLNARVVCTVTDVTANAEAEARLRLASEKAEAANRAKSEFLANMSHELRTPLNGVMAMAELLDDGSLPERQAGMLRTIQDSGALLLSIVNDLLDLAKVESGKLTLEERPVLLGDLVTKVEAMHSLSARAKGVLLVAEVSADLRAPVLADEKRLLQVMHNLLGNALKFTETGEVRLTVARDDQGRVVLTVADTGIGMTAEQAARVFDEFTQADGTITRRFGGTGLGLPIVRRLVEQMKGTISMYSTPGIGTVLAVTLPLCDAPDAAPPAKPASLPPLLRAEGAGPFHALVAEDNLTNQVILRAMLGRLGVQASFVNDGDQAVAAAGQGGFDLLLLDISMPRKDGITALAEIRTGAAASPVPPAIAVTANAMAHHLEDYRAAGFAAVVAKPIRLDDLARAIAQVLAPT